jgi:hypothetical protein
MLRGMLYHDPLYVKMEKLDILVELVKTPFKCYRMLPVCPPLFTPSMTLITVTNLDRRSLTFL